MNKIYILVITIIFFSINSWAQNPSFTWAKGMGGPTNDVGNSIITDGFGNIYTTGYFTGTVDFDPGVGTFTMTSAGSLDIFISKLDLNGNFVWAKQIGGTSNDQGLSIAIDASSNVYTTGFFGNLVDFDPGVGTFTMTSAGGSSDIFISKLDANGNFVWAKQMGGTPNADWGQSIKIDGGGNVFTTGYFFGTVDFDPGVGINNMASSGNNDVFISKLDASGNFVWAKQFGGSGDDRGESIAIDALGNVFTAGFFNNTSDFDPGAGVFNITSNGASDIFVSKLDATGNFVWAKQIGGVGSDIANSIAIDASNNVYTTGSYSLTADFDPGAGIFNITSAGLQDIFISKLDASGLFIWAKSIGSTASEAANSIGLDVSGNVFTTGNLNGTGDFDPGAGIFNLTPIGNSDIFISKLSSIGNFIWAGQIGGVTANNTGSEIVFDLVGNIYITGSFFATDDFDAGVGVVNMNSIGGADCFVIKYCQVPSQPSAISGNTITCLNSLNAYSINGVPGASSYTWSFPLGWSGSSATNTISATPGSSGVFSVTASNACGTSSMQTLSITVNALPSISAATSTTQLCIGQSATLTASGGNSYTWNPGGTGTTIVISPSVNTTYTLTGTDLNTCQNNTVITQNVMNCSTTGLAPSPLEKAGDEAVYPNPFNNKITVIAGESKQDIVIYNSIGQIIYTALSPLEEAGDKTEIDISKEPNGIYFIRIGSITKKIIKQ